MPATIQKILKPTKYRAVDTSTSLQIVSPNLVTGDSANFGSGLGIWEGVRGTAAHDTNQAKFTTLNAYHESATQMVSYPIGLKTTSGFFSGGDPAEDWAEQGQWFKVKFKAKYSSTSNLDCAVPFNYVGNGASNWTAIKNPNMTTSYQDYEFNVPRTWTGDSFYIATTDVVGLDAVSGEEDVFFVDDIEIYAMLSFGNNNHGQIYSGRALEFDGIGDYLSVSSDLSSTVFGSYLKTFACWFRTDNSTPETIIEAGWLSANCITIESGYIGASSFDNGDDVMTSSAIIENDTWYRLVVTSDIDHSDSAVVDAAYADGFSNYTIYINGVKQTLQAGNNYRNGGDMLLGARQSSGNFEYHFAGKMSDVQGWDTVWTQSDATFDYLNPESLALNNGGTSLTESNLKLWYPMQDGHRGQQSYILDGANTGLGDNILTNGDMELDDASWTVTAAMESSNPIPSNDDPAGLDSANYSTVKSYTGGRSLYVTTDYPNEGIQNATATVVEGVFCSGI